MLSSDSKDEGFMNRAERRRYAKLKGYFKGSGRREWRLMTNADTNVTVNHGIKAFKRLQQSIAGGRKKVDQKLIQTYKSNAWGAKS